jgi:hypothetical protein
MLVWKRVTKTTKIIYCLMTLFQTEWCRSLIRMRRCVWEKVQWRDIIRHQVGTLVSDIMPVSWRSENIRTMSKYILFNYKVKAYKYFEFCPKWLLLQWGESPHILRLWQLVMSDRPEALLPLLRVKSIPWCPMNMKMGGSQRRYRLWERIIIIIIISCHRFSFFPGTSPLEPVVNPTTQASSLSL